MSEQTELSLPPDWVTFIERDDVPKVEIMPGFFKQTLAVGKNLMVVFITGMKDASFPMHHHAPEQCGYVISGALEMTIGDETRIIRAGSSYVAAGDQPHTARVLEECTLIDVFSPVREEYR